MHLFLEYTILGLVTGAVYGIAASGLVLTYTTSGIFNFAQGAMAMLAAFTYWQFRYGWNWPAPLALFVVIAVLAPLVGALLYGGIMRGLRETAEVTKIVVTIGIMLGPDRAGPVDLEPRCAADGPALLRRCRQVPGLRRLRHRPRGDRSGLRRPHRGRHPPPLQEHPHRRRHAGRGGQSGAPPAQRRTTRTAGRLLVGARWCSGGAGRHPHHPDQRGHARRPRTDAARPRLHRRRDVRPAAQHLAARSPARSSSAWPAPMCWAISRPPGPGPRTSGSRCR